MFRRKIVWERENYQFCGYQEALGGRAIAAILLLDMTSHCSNHDKHTSWFFLTFYFGMMHFSDFWLNYALLSQNVVVAIYAIFPQIFWDWKVKSADFYTFRMYASPMHVVPVFNMNFLFDWICTFFSSRDNSRSPLVKFFDEERATNLGKLN